MPPFTSLLLFDQFTFTKLTGHKNWKDKCRYKNEHVDRRITSFPFDLKCCPFSMHINHFTVATILAAFICCSITIMTDFFVTPWTAAHQASLSFSSSWSLLKLMSIKSVTPSNHLILCFSPSPPALKLSQHQGLFKWVISLHQVAKILEFQFQHQASNEHSGLISFRMDWLDLVAVQKTLKSLL